MDVSERVERAIARHLADRCGPPLLGSAMHHALFPGGARVRPTLALLVANACGDDRPPVADALAVAVEALHCASLVHDDLPAFDDADQRRGRPSVHRAHGEAMAVLAGDALIVLAFQALADVADPAGERLGALLAIVAAAGGAPDGLVGGQAMESEPACDVGAYHAAKTAVLFEAATTGGAVAAGGDPARWRPVGAALGRAYQIADDIHDRVGTGSHGKPVGQDTAHQRPSALDANGLDGALASLRGRIEEAVDAVPNGPGAEPIRALMRRQVNRFLPAHLAATA